MRQEATKKRQTILLVVNEPGEFVELLRIAIAASQRHWSIAFLFAQYGYINLRTDRATCQRLGFSAYFPGMILDNDHEAALAEQREKPLKNGYYPNSLVGGLGQKDGIPRWKLLLLLLGIAPLFLFKRFFVRREKSHKNRLYLRSLLFSLKIYKRTKPAIVIFGQEFPGSPNSLITQRCNKDGVPTLIVPFAVGTPKEMVESLHDKKDHWVKINVPNRIAARLFPQWVNYYRGKELIRLPGQTIFLLEFLNLTPPHPWIPNSSYVTKIAVECESMMQYYASMRFPPSQLELTGATYDDAIVKARRSVVEHKAKTAERLRLDPGKRWLVCAWPTNQYGSRNEPLEFRNYEQLCHAWASALQAVAAQTTFEVIICPHPVSDITYVRQILSLYGLHTRIATNGTLAMVCCSDLFVACVSSTIRWAISLGVPVINYDCYEYGYTDFDAAGGVVTVTHSSDFESQLMAWTKNPTTYHAALQKQEECAGQWGIHDGESTTRIISLIDRLATTQAIN
ncbi:MAG TPA: hypothetical protein DIW64_03025 [Cellvibrio sp.]|nr:hypothetical protein [Cellvibrio sp.]